MELAARRKYFSRMYRAPCRPKPACLARSEATALGHRVRRPLAARNLRTSRADCGSKGHSRSRRPLPRNADEWRRIQVEVTRLQVKKFLNTGASVVEHTEEHVITFSVLGRAINLRQQVTKFLLAQIAQYRTEGLFRRNRQNRAAQSGQRGLLASDIAEKCLYGGQPRIARADRVGATGFQIGSGSPAPLEH